MAFTIDKDYLIRPHSHAVIDVPIPAEGSKVTMIQGYPQSGGRDIGEMETAPKLKIMGSKENVKIVNQAAPIDQYLKDPGATLEILVNRYTSSNIALAFRSATRMNADGSMSVGIGDNTELTGHSIFVSFESKNNSGVWFYIMLYDAVIVNEMEVEYGPEKSVGMLYAFEGRPVSGRSIDFSIGEHNVPAQFIL